MLLLLASGAALTGCGKDLPQTPFDPHGPVARMQLGLLNYTMWLAAFIGIVVSVIVVVVVLRFRAKPGDNSIPKQIHGDTRLEILWTVIPILILASVAVPTVQTAFSTAKPPENEEAITVKVTASQWWFAFEYQDYKMATTGAKPEDKVTTGNELLIPVGKNVVLKLNSKDVIHSFWIPKLAGKTDLIPNRENSMWIKADDAGEYWGQCAEYCGTAHAMMRFRVRAVPQAEFDKWVADQADGAMQPVAGTVEAAGKALMEGEGKKVSCFGCHSIDGSDKLKGKVGPNLSNIGSRHTLGAGLVDNTEENLRKWIRDPKSIKPTEKMPAHPQLSDDELNSIVKYLQSLK